MNFREFTHKHLSGSKQDYIALCEKGLEFHERTKDILHDKSHLERLFHLLDEYLEIHKLSQERLENLVLSICWHDVFKATLNPHNPLELILGFLFDGPGSGILFLKHFNGAVEWRRALQVLYSISTHSKSITGTHLTTESRMLSDMDSVDLWHPERLIKAIEYKTTTGVSALTNFLVRRYVGFVMRFSLNGFYYDAFFKSKGRHNRKQFCRIYYDR